MSTTQVATARSVDRLITVILPAYNEAQNLPVLIERIGSVLGLSDHPYRILVVDDGSRDGTAEVARSLNGVPVAVVSHEENQGLGRALRTGLLEVIRDSGVVVTMDADNTHDPEVIPRLLERLEAGYDVVIASRYVEGGAEIGVPRHRQMLSHLASRVYRRVAALNGVRDYSSRFRAYRGDLLRRLLERHGDRALVSQEGFASELELLLKAGYVGAGISEVPLELRYDQKAGPSKLQLFEAARGYGTVLHIYREIRRADQRRGTLGGLPRLGAWASSEQALRVVNVIAASAALLIAAPVMTAISLAIKLTSPGPVFYKQVRVGIDRRNGRRNQYDCRRRIDLGGKLFMMFKFRSMNHSSHDGQKQVWARPQDPRVTPVGRVIRKYRLDELPQLFNVLRGEMNIVGPRPEQPDIFEQLRSSLEGYGGRQRVRPGITGWAQVNQSYDRTLDDVRRKLALDLEYINHRSVLADISILLRTVPTVLFRRGAW